MQYKTLDRHPRRQCNVFGFKNSGDDGRLHLDLQKNEEHETR